MPACNKIRTRTVLTIDGDVIQAISIIDWMDAMGFDWKTPYAETQVALDEYLANHLDTTYFAAPREEFSFGRAARTAADGGYSKVIVEDLS